MTRLPKPQELHRIAVVCFGGVGDVLLFSPVLAELKAWLPHCHMSLLVEGRSAAVSEVLEYADSVVALKTPTSERRALFEELTRELKSRHYDAVVSNGTSPFISVMMAMSGIGYRVGYSGAWWSRWLLSSGAEVQQKQYASGLYFALAEAFLKPLLKERYERRVALRPGVKPVDEETLAKVRPLLLKPALDEVERKHILLHPGVSKAGLMKGINKTWPPSRWAELILLVSKQHYVYLIGGPDDEETIGKIMAGLPDRLERFVNVTGKTQRFSELAGVMEVMDAVVCVDSAPLHLAVGLEKPTVVLFGPTDEAKLVPPDNDNVVVVKRDDLSCRPCLWEQRQRNCAESTCLEVGVTEMAQALERLLGVKVGW